MEEKKKEKETKTKTKTRSSISERELNSKNKKSGVKLFQCNENNNDFNRSKNKYFIC